jgi:hypothetical protein
VGPHGQIIDGAVAGPLYATTIVVIVPVAFTNPTFHRLPADDNAMVSVSVSLSVSNEDKVDHQQQFPETPQEHHRHVTRRRPAPHLAVPVLATQPWSPVRCPSSPATRSPKI